MFTRLVTRFFGKRTSSSFKTLNKHTKKPSQKTSYGKITQAQSRETCTYSSQNLKKQINLGVESFNTKIFLSKNQILKEYQNQLKKLTKKELIDECISYYKLCCGQTSNNKKQSFLDTSTILNLSTVVGKMERIWKKKTISKPCCKSQKSGNSEQDLFFNDNFFIPSEKLCYSAKKSAASKKQESGSQKIQQIFMLYPNPFSYFKYTQVLGSGLPQNVSIALLLRDQSCYRAPTIQELFKISRKPSNFLCLYNLQKYKLIAKLQSYNFSYKFTGEQLCKSVCKLMAIYKDRNQIEVPLKLRKKWLRVLKNKVELKDQSLVMDVIQFLENYQQYGYVEIMNQDTLSKLSIRRLKKVWEYFSKCKSIKSRTWCKLARQEIISKVLQRFNSKTETLCPRSTVMYRNLIRKLVGNNLRKEIRLNPKLKKFIFQV